MKTKDTIMKCAAAAAFALFAGAAAADAPYTPEKWNLDARKKFADQRFGIFIHWGLYANYAQGEWYLQSGKLDREAYERMIDGFCPSKFDAKEWVAAIKGSGAKYLTITSRHHDGFSLWPTKVDDGYNIANTPFKRDILGELAAECAKAGIQLNFYYSLMDWHRADYPAGRASKVVLKDQKGDYDSYKKFMLGQIGELIDNYHPGNIWFDGEWDHTQHQKDGTWKRTLDWKFDEIYDFIHARKTLVANNNHQPIRPKEDIQLFERDLPGHGTAFSAHQPVTNDRPVEQCDIIQYGVWGYRIGQSKFRSADNVVAMCASTAARGANLLMNVGPDGSGRFPAKAVAILADVGKWFAKNGESIYGTQGCPIAKGGDIVATRNGSTLYLHFLKPGVDEITFDIDGELVSAAPLGGRGKVAAKIADGKATVKIERPADDPFDFVAKIVVK